MAGNNDGAGNDPNPPAQRHFEYLSSTFVGHFNNLPEMLSAEQTPRPLDKDLYAEDQDSDQSNTCARLAVEFYSQQPGNIPISLLRAKDSHKFSLDDGTVYFHVNFKAVIDNPAIREPQPYTFFAEVTGEMGPENVTMVVLFRTKEERQTRDNCSHCTGLRHPKQGGFMGYQPEDEDDGDEDADEDDGDEDADDSDAE